MEFAKISSNIIFLNLFIYLYICPLTPAYRRQALKGEYVGYIEFLLIL
jgi:hypothetical protein